MEKINFTNGQAPVLNGANLNQLQTNIENEFANTKCKMVHLHGLIDSKGTFTLKDNANDYDLILVFATGNTYYHRQMCSILMANNYVQTVQLEPDKYENNFKINGTTADTTGSTYIGTSSYIITAIYGLKLR